MLTEVEKERKKERKMEKKRERKTESLSLSRFTFQSPLFNFSFSTFLSHTLFSIFAKCWTQCCPLAGLLFLFLFWCICSIVLRGYLCPLVRRSICRSVSNHFVKKIDRNLTEFSKTIWDPKWRSRCQIYLNGSEEQLVGSWSQLEGSKGQLQSCEG